MISASLEERWRETWTLLDRPAPDGRLAPLLARYAERHRAYHTVAHVLSCLELAKIVRRDLVRPGLVELALWYHDAVYEPRRSDNEEASARLAARALEGLPAASVAEVERLVLATRHPSDPSDGDAMFVVDIDLAILGAPPAEFDAYEAAIRREYRWVPAPLYRRGRSQVLAAFLARERIYCTDSFRGRLETAARANLARSLARLR